MSSSKCHLIDRWVINLSKRLKTSWKMLFLSFFLKNDLRQKSLHPIYYFGPKKSTMNIIQREKKTAVCPCSILWWFLYEKCRYAVGPSGLENLLSNIVNLENQGCIYKNKYKCFKYNFFLLKKRVGWFTENQFSFSFRFSFSTMQVVTVFKYSGATL